MYLTRAYFAGLTDFSVSDPQKFLGDPVQKIKVWFHSQHPLLWWSMIWQRIPNVLFKWSQSYLLNILVCGAHFRTWTFFGKPIRASSNFQITVCSRCPKKSSNFLCMRSGKSLLLMLDPRLKKMTPLVDRSSSCCKLWRKNRSLICNSEYR